MKLSELIERLEDLQAGYDGDFDPEIVAAYQPNYPLAGTVLGATVLRSEEESDGVEEDALDVVWLAIGGHPHGMSPYAPAQVFEEV